MPLDAAAAHLSALERLLDIQPVDLRSALGQAADVIAELTGAEKVDVLLREPLVAALVAVGVSGTPLAARQRALGLDRQPLANGGRAVRVLESGEPYLHADVAEDPEELPGVRGALGVRSEAMVPFDVGGAPRGVLAIASTRAGAFDEMHLRFLRSSARWVGLVADRAEAVERLAREAEDRGRRAAAEELVTVVAHDLRNYISPVHGRVVLLKRRAQRDGREPDLRDAELAERSLQRLVRVLTDLLDVGRIEQGLFQLEVAPVDVAALARELAGALELPDRRIEVSAPGEAIVEGDPVKLRQAVENVLSNASKHAPAGTPIRVAVGPDAGPPPTIRVDVSDEGPGIDPGVAPRIFARFARGSGSGGLGLGLYLAREIARAHGGTLDFSPAPRRGTTFTFRLPAR